MTGSASAALIAIAMMGGQAVMANSGPIQFLDSIQGNNLLAIQSTMDVFQRRQPDFSRSRFDVVRKGNSTVVILAEQDRQAGTRGNVGVDVATKTELSPQDVLAIESNPDQYPVMDRILGSNLLAVQTAMREFQQHQPDLTQYKIEVISDGTVLSVLFADKDRPPGTRGSIGQPGFAVELDAKDRTVINSSFVR